MASENNQIDLQNTAKESNETQNFTKAVFKNDSECVLDMLNKFSPEEKRRILDDESSYKDHLDASYAPIHLACLMGSRKMIDAMLSHGADVTMVNNAGKNIIHMLIDATEHRPKMALEMYDFVMSKCSAEQKKMLLDTRFGKHPPHVYAIRKGRLHMADAIIHTNDVYRHVLKMCGAYSVVRYDLHIQDTAPHKCPIRSMLQLSLNQVKSTETGDVILRRPWSMWLSQVWSDYAWVVVLWCLARFIHLVILTLCCVYRPLKMAKTSNSSGAATDDTFSYVMTYGITYLLVFISVAAILPNIFRFCQLSTLRSLKNALHFCVKHTYKSVKKIKRPEDSNLTHGRLFWVLSLLMHVSFLVSVLFAHLSLSYEDTALSLSVVLCYLSMLFFCTVIPRLGHFSIIIEQTVMDILNFTFFYVFVLLGFSAAFYTLFQMEDDVEEFGSYRRTVFTVFYMTFNVIDVDTLLMARAPPAAIICFVIYVVIVVVALLNFLIAILSQTVSELTESRHIAFSLNRASVALFLQEYTLVRFFKNTMSRISKCGHKFTSDPLCSVTVVEYRHDE